MLSSLLGAIAAPIRPYVEGAILAVAAALLLALVWAHTITIPGLHKDVDVAVANQHAAEAARDEQKARRVAAEADGAALRVQISAQNAEVEHIAKDCKQASGVAAEKAKADVAKPVALPKSRAAADANAWAAGELAKLRSRK